MAGLLNGKVLFICPFISKLFRIQLFILSSILIFIEVRYNRKSFPPINFAFKMTLALHAWSKRDIRNVNALAQFLKSLKFKQSTFFKLW